MTFAVLCPGQGAQHPGMLDLAAAHPAGLRVLDRAGAALGEDPRRWLAQGEAIFRNAIAQPLICIAQLAMWSVLRDDLDAPSAVAGYSVGELACYGLADAVDAGELADLARVRAKLMDAANAAEPGGLVAIRGLGRPALERACAGARAWIAIVVADDAYVVGGSQAALEAVRERAAAAGAQITALGVDVASHTPLLASAAGEFRDALARSALGAPARPVIAGVDAMAVTTRARAIETLSAQIARTVEWAKCLDALHERGCRVFLELGPGRALARTVGERFDDVEARSVEDFREAKAIVAWVRRKIA